MREIPQCYEFSRPKILDRTGELMEVAFDQAEKHIKPQLAMIEEPGTGIQFPVPVVEWDKRPPRFVAFSKPDGFDAYRDKPKFRKGIAVMTRIDSFIDHVNRFKDDNSVIFAGDGENPSLTAVIDYHEETWNEGVVPDASPRFGQHRTSFRFPLSEEWKAWSESNGIKIGLLDLAQFLEDRITDIMLVGDGDLNDDYEAVRRGHRCQDSNTVLDDGWNSHADLASTKTPMCRTCGTCHLVKHRYHSTPIMWMLTESRYQFRFVCNLHPGFANDTAYYRIAARLRYRKSGPEIKFWYELWRADKVFINAFDEACARVKSECDLPIAGRLTRIEK